MRRFLGISLWLIACCVCIAPAVAFWQSRDSNYNVNIASGGFTPSCSQSSTFLAAATGVTLTADKTNYDTLICGLVSDGVWNFDALYIWAAPDQTTALINLANPGTFNGTTHGTVSFSAYNGFTGDGSTFYVDSGFNPTTATTPNFVQNSATAGVYILTASTPGGSTWQVGCASGSCTDGPLLFAYKLGSFGGQINSITGVTAGSSNTQGAWNLTRSSSADVAMFLNSSENPAANTSDTSAAPTNTDIIFFAFNSGFGLTTEQMAAGWITKGVGSQTPGSGVNSCKINNRINTYMGNLTISKSVYVNSAC